MRAVVVIPICCMRARVALSRIRDVRVMVEIDKFLCGEIDERVAIEEVVRICKKANGRMSQFAWTIVVEECNWEELEEVVAEVGGDVVYV